VQLQGPDSSPGDAAAPTSDEQKAVSTKKPGTIRLGLAGIRTASVGEGINAAELSAAIQNLLGEYLKGTKIEIVPLEAKLASAQSDEAKQKGCDYVIVATASHKKGGGGFGLGTMVARTVAQTGMVNTGSVAGNVAGQAATTAIVTATSISGNFKSKDELTLDLKLLPTTDNSSPITRQFKVKAKSDGDDIITPIVEQAAQAIVDAVGK
jgi:microcystin degradation protein MlrC